MPGGSFLVEALTTVFASVMGGYHQEHDAQTDRHTTIHATGAIYERNRFTPVASRDAAIGVPYAVPFVPGNFFGFGTMGWTVVAGNVVTFIYDLVGMSMNLSFTLQSTTVTVSGGLTAALQMKIPDGWYAAYAVRNDIHIFDNAVPVTGYIVSAANSNLLSVFRTDGANFAASAGATSIMGQIRIPIRTA
jgi:hypothetical protein